MPPNANDPSARAAPRHRVLLVEDNPGDADFTTEQLADAPVGSFEVRATTTLAETVDLLAKTAADAVILDLNLPDSRGVATLVRVKEAARDAPIIVLSGAVNDTLREDAMSAGAVEVFAKSEASGRLFSRSVLYVIERLRARAHDRQLETLLATTPDAILVVTTTGAVRYVNAAALALFGRTREELLGELLGFSVRDGEPTEIVIPRPEGPRICEMRVVRFEWQGEPAYLGAIRDVTELKASQREATAKARLAEERTALLRRMLDEIAALARRLGLADVASAPAPLLAAAPDHPPTEATIAAALRPFEVAFRGYVESNAQLAAQNHALAEAKAATDAANRELDAFSYSVAHDLRAPLRAIDGFGQALVEDAAETLTDEARQHLTRIRDATQRMAQLIDALLHLARVTRRELRRATVDLSKLARTAWRDLAAGGDARDVELVIAEGVVGDGDEHLLQLVLTNLLGNALKFTGKTAHPRIEFGCAEVDGEPTYVVRDNGAGFDPAYADKLFGVFQRLHATSEFEGTGVGLSIVKRVIHRHGGRVWASGAVGQGATFHFTLGAPA